MADWSTADAELERDLAAAVAESDHAAPRCARALSQPVRPCCDGRAKQQRSESSHLRFRSTAHRRARGHASSARRATVAGLCTRGCMHGAAVSAHEILNP